MTVKIQKYAPDLMISSLPVTWTWHWSESLYWRQEFKARNSSLHFMRGCVIHFKKRGRKRKKEAVKYKKWRRLKVMFIWWNHKHTNSSYKLLYIARRGKKLHSGLFTWVHLLEYAPCNANKRKYNNPFFTHFPSLIFWIVVTTESLFSRNIVVLI